jgi:mannose-1-phosphate guanylyltransferase
MAGGSGTRFWPESRAARPKQLLSLVGGRSMLQMTIDRLAGLVPPERTLVVTGAALVDAVAAQLPQLPRGAIVGEPCKRDTAPCIGLAAMMMARTDPDTTMLVLPADHVIRPEEVFRDAAALAAGLIDAQGAAGRIVTFGAKPTYPAEAFGYIERGELITRAPGAPPVYQVRQFREKPPRKLAEEYLAQGGFYWNCGIFVWKARTILAALRQRQPEMYERLERIIKAMETGRFQEVLSREFAAIRPISIDYAVMEDAQDVVVVEAPFEWDDLGSWQALGRHLQLDEHGNAVSARHAGFNTRGCVVRGPADHLIVTLGLADCVVVHTADATLVANKHDEESMRQVAKLLQERGWAEYL